MKKSFIFLIAFIMSIVVSCSYNPADMTEFDDDMARFMIPIGAELISAELYINVTYASAIDSVVTLHRITEPWEEMEVTWNSFNSSYDPTVIDSAVIGTLGWHSFDITQLVLDWVEGTYPMHGVLLDQGLSSGYTIFRSREGSLNPYLKMVLSLNNSLLEEDPEAVIADTYIWEFSPDTNYGGNYNLYTGLIELEKQTLINFEFEEDEDEKGTGTPGYWKNHPESWPVDEIVVGCVTYTKEEAISIMSLPIKKYKWYTLFKAFVAAKLNVLIGADDFPIADILVLAEAWLCQNNISVTARSDAWKEAEPLYILLDDYNNGFLGVPSRDSLE